MLNTKDDRILNSQTVSRIITRKSVESAYLNLKQYYYDIRIKGNLVFLKIKKPYESKLSGIVNDLEHLFTNNVKLNNFNISVTREVPTNPIYNSILVIKNNYNTIKLLFPIVKQKLPIVPRVLRPGIANEDLFESLVKTTLNFINEQVKDVREIFPTEFSPRLTLLIYEGNNTTPSSKIGPIRTIEQVGEDTDEEGLQKKPDIKITTTSGIKNISIKMNNHPAWSSARKYTGAKNILDHLTSNNIISITGPKENRNFIFNNINYSGLVFPATLGEVKKFCFNDTEINYIIVKSFSNNDIISEVSRYGNNINDFSIDFKVNVIYENTQQGIAKLKPDVYLLIKSKNTVSSGLKTNDNRYDGFSINFIPKSKIKQNYAVINNIPNNLSGRL